MRKLTNEEKRLAEKNLKRLREELDNLQKQWDYNEATIKFQQVQREFEKAKRAYQNKVRPYLEEQKDKEDQKIVETITQDIHMKTDTIKTLKEQIENGVKIKNETS